MGLPADRHLAALALHAARPVDLLRDQRAETRGDLLEQHFAALILGSLHPEPDPRRVYGPDLLWRRYLPDAR